VAGLLAAAAELLKVLVWLTPAAIVDEGGQRQMQPAYLNFDISIEGPPCGNRMQVCIFPFLIAETPSLLHSSQPCWASWPAHHAPATWYAPHAHRAS
jgi:hypothetical protein